MRRVRRKKQGLRAEMNIVPYVDVMFVLLTIFMVTATTIPLGADIDAPEIESVTERENVVDDYVMISVGKDGQYFMSDTDNPEAELEMAGLIDSVMAFKQREPKRAVYIRADRDAPYGKLIDAMDQVQKSTGEKVKLTTPQSN